jgi:hypothetical protein
MSCSYYARTFYFHHAKSIFTVRSLWMSGAVTLAHNFFFLTSTRIDYVQVLLLHGKFLSTRKSTVPIQFQSTPIDHSSQFVPPKYFRCTDPPSVTVFTSYGPNQCILNLPGC